MKIRKMEQKDYSSIDALMQKLHRIHVNGRPDLYIDMEHPYFIEDYTKMLSDENVLGYVAETDNQVVGLCIASIRSKSGMVSIKTAYLDDMVIDETYRNRGIAKLLFHTIEAEARKLGAVRLDLMVWEFNEDAKELYKSLGMTPQRYIYEKKLQ